MSFALRRKTLRRGARNAGMGDGAFELLLSAPHRRATRASAAAARTEDGVQRRDIDRKDPRGPGGLAVLDRKSTRLNSSHSQISYAVFCLKKKKKQFTIKQISMDRISTDLNTW